MSHWPFQVDEESRCEEQTRSSIRCCVQPRKGGDVEIVQSRQVVDAVHALVKNGGGLARDQNPKTGRHSEPRIELQVWECWYGPGTGSLTMATWDAGGRQPRSSRRNGSAWNSTPK